MEHAAQVKKTSSGVRSRPKPDPGPWHAQLPAPGVPLDVQTRSVLEPRFGHDFSRVRVHADGDAAERADAFGAIAFTQGRDVFFARGRYQPQSTTGRLILAHELAHVIQQGVRPAVPLSEAYVDVLGGGTAQEEAAHAAARELGQAHAPPAGTADGVRRRLRGSPPPHRSSTREPVQRFTAELEDTRVLLRREPQDSSRDLARILGGSPIFPGDAAETVDVTSMLPAGVTLALRSGPFNCAHFVKIALRDKPVALEERSTLFTVALWEELLAGGFTVSGLWRVDKGGRLIPGKSLNKKHRIATPQSSPRLGDLVFMSGSIAFKPGHPTVIDPRAENFSVGWDHVGIFLVRDRRGRDWHLAKDGDENPIGVYHTGMKMMPGDAPGAYVEGLESLLMYLTPPPVRVPDWQDAGAGRP
jgi:hypothetical protein